MHPERVPVWQNHRMTNTLLGIDVSEAQGSVDFAQVRSGGFCFCICKASEGADFQDKTFVTNLQRIYELDSGATFFPGAYHFGRPDHRSGRSGGETEGKWFAQVLQTTARSLGVSFTNGFLEPVLDMEIYDKSDAGDNVEWIDGFLSVIQSELGRKGMVYSGPNYWQYQVADTDKFAVAGIPLWQVKYNKQGNDPTQAAPTMIVDTSKTSWTPSLWQWSGGGDYAYYNQQVGSIPGIVGGVADVDRVMGDESLLRTLAAANVPSGFQRRDEPDCEPLVPDRRPQVAPRRDEHDGRTRAGPLAIAQLRPGRAAELEDQPARREVRRRDRERAVGLQALGRAACGLDRGRSDLAAARHQRQRLSSIDSICHVRPPPDTDSNR